VALLASMPRLDFFSMIFLSPMSLIGVLFRLLGLSNHSHGRKRNEAKRSENDSVCSGSGAYFFGL
jgi:hypothetical protein